MSTKQIPNVVLNSCQKMPMIGMGTADIPLPPTDVLISHLIDAIEVGYRHFDTAAVYGSEEALGKAIAQALERGLVKSRDELFITTKLWCNMAHNDLVLPALQASLKKLGLEYLDLYLVHFPVRTKKELDGYIFTKEDILHFDIKGTWEAMQKCQKMGLVKSIGVSNFGPKKLAKILEFASIPPAVDQVEMHVAWQQGILREFCKENGIHVCAWSPLGANGALWGTNDVMQSHVLKEIAESKGKSVAQVALRWIHEQGVTMVPKSFNKTRMAQNLDIFDWELTDDERSKIKTMIPQRRGYKGEAYVNENGPSYKSLDELWDGEP